MEDGKDIVVNIVPKLDVRDAQKAAETLEDIYGGTLTRAEKRILAQMKNISRLDKKSESLHKKIKDDADAYNDYMQNKYVPDEKAFNNYKKLRSEAESKKASILSKYPSLEALQYTAKTGRYFGTEVGADGKTKRRGSFAPTSYVNQARLDDADYYETNRLIWKNYDPHITKWNEEQAEKSKILKQNDGSVFKSMYEQHIDIVNEAAEVDEKASIASELLAKSLNELANTAPDVALKFKPLIDELNTGFNMRGSITDPQQLLDSKNPDMPKHENNGMIWYDLSNFINVDANKNLDVILKKLPKFSRDVLKLEGVFKTLTPHIFKGTSALKKFVLAGIGVRSVYFLFRKLWQGFYKNLGVLSQYDSELNNILSAFKTQYAEFSANLTSAFSPIIKTILPMVTSLLKNLSEEAVKVGEAIAKMTGQKVFYKASQEWIDYADSINGANQALAGFDKLNVVSATPELTYSAENLDDIDTTETESRLRNLLVTVAAVTLSVLGLKAAIGILNTYLKLKDGFETFELLAREMSLTAGELASVIGGIALVIVGVAVTVVGAIDMFANGVTWLNSLLVIVGTTLAAVGLALLGVIEWPAVLVAAIVAAAVVASQWINKFHDEIVNWFDGIKEKVNGFFDSLDTKWESFKKKLGGLGGIVGLYIDPVITIFKQLKDILVGVWDTVKYLISALGDLGGALKSALNGDWKSAWAYLVNFFVDIGNCLVSALNGMLSVVEDGINGMITLINDAFSTLNSVINAVTESKIGKFFGWSSVNLHLNEVSLAKIPEIPRMEIPGLATGSVVPPNAPFLAMLGDNKKETEVVSPLSTMKEAMIEALQSMNLGGEQRIILNLDGKTVYDRMVSINNEQKKRTGVSQLA